MKNLINKLIFFLSISLCFSFARLEPKHIVVEAINSSKSNLRSYTIEIEVTKLRELKIPSQELNFVVEDELGKKVLSQMVDADTDGIPDFLIFQTDIDAKQTRRFHIQLDTLREKTENNTTSTYSRFVQERMDDFAWENDKVAFRAFGPKAQQLKESGDKEGLISSGIDCWLKRVSYPIINKWYEKDKNGGSYHLDDGEGLDNFNVGISRGCGGTALFINNKFYTSQNYSSWKLLTNGPIRSVFELGYKPISVNDNIITETKRITIDLGSNLYKCEESFKSVKLISEIGVGISLHENKGSINTGKKRRWVSYWEPIGDSELGMAVVLPEDFINIIKKENQPHDDNNLWIISKIKNNKATYYAGFGWRKSNEFKNNIEWGKYLDAFADQTKADVTLKIK